VLFNVQIVKNKKRIAMLSFTPNITTIPLIILRLSYIFRSAHSSDLPFDTFTLALVSEIHINYSIIASSMPFMRPIVESLAIGLMTNEIRIPAEDATGTGSNPKEESNNNRINPFALLSGRGRKTNNVYVRSRTKTDAVVGTKGNFISSITAGQKDDAVELSLRENTERYGSQERMVINQMRVTVVSSEVGTDWSG